MAQLHRDNGGYLGINVRETADPWWDNVVLLLQPKAGDTSIVDYSPSGKSITNNGVTLDSSNEKWTGAPSMLFEATNSDDLVLSDSDDWFYGTFDFTIEAFSYVNAKTGDQGVVGQTADTSNYTTIWYDFNNSNGLKLASVETGTTNIQVQDDNTPWDASVWQHVAVTRNGDTIRLFSDGVIVATTTTTNDIPNRSQSLRVGNFDGVGYFDGNMTSLRITKGVARYTSNFTPPTRPFPTRRYVSGIIQP
jgi:hypothetical protein